MSLISSLPGAVSFLVTLLDQAYLSVIATIWYYVVHYGLTPRYSYPTGIGGNQSFLSFYGFLVDNVYVTVAGLLVLTGAFVVVASNSIGKTQLPSSFIYRTAFAITLSFFSLQISILVMKLSLALFLQVWDHGNFDWYSLFSVTGSVDQIKSSFSQDPFFKVIEFLILSVLFAGSGALLAILEVRQAMMLFLMLTLPLFSLFFTLKGLDNLAIKFWKLFIELNFLPFFILIILFTIHFFPNDFPLQIGTIIFAATSPYLLVTVSSSLTSRATALMNPGEFMGKASNPMRAAGNLAKSHIPGISGMGQINAQTTPRDGFRGKSLMEIAEMKDFEYRRFGGNPNEK